MERSTVAATNRWGRGPSGGAHGAGFNELFHPPLVPPLNRRFHRRFSSGARPLAPRSIRVHVRFRAASPPSFIFFFFSLWKISKTLSFLLSFSKSRSGNCKLASFVTNDRLIELLNRCCYSSCCSGRSLVGAENVSSFDYTDLKRV